jgi:hypothetical protein
MYDNELEYEYFKQDIVVVNNDDAHIHDSKAKKDKLNPEMGDFIFDINHDAIITKKQGNWTLYLPTDCFDYLNPLVVIPNIEFTNLKSYKYVRNPKLYNVLSKATISYAKYNISINYDTGTIESNAYNVDEVGFGPIINRCNTMYESAFRNILYDALANFVSSLQGSE